MLPAPTPSCVSPVTLWWACYNFQERLRKVMGDSGKNIFRHGLLGMLHTSFFFQRRETWCQEQKQTWYLIMSMSLLPLSPHWCCVCVWAQLRLKCESSEPSGLQNTSHKQTWLMNIWIFSLSGGRARIITLQRSADLLLTFCTVGSRLRHHSIILKN